jgi:hypothetical protein
MYVAGLDPGGTIGAAKIHERPDGELICFAREFKDPVEAWLWLDDGTLDSVAVEDFVGAGYRNRDSTMTTKQVGGFEMAARLAGVPVEVVQPSVRRRWLAWSYQELELPETPSHDPNHVSALAHARAHLERIRRNNA